MRSARGCSSDTASTSGWVNRCSQLTPSSVGRRAVSSRSRWLSARTIDPRASSEECEPEAHPGVVARKVSTRSGTSHAPRDSWKTIETDPVSGSMSSLDGSEPVVEGVQGGVHVPLEHRARVGRPEHPPAPEQQRRADLLLESRQRPRDAGLADQVELGHLGDGGPVGDELEPAERLRRPFHDASAWISAANYIGRMDQDLKRSSHDLQHARSSAAATAATPCDPRPPSPRSSVPATTRRRPRRGRLARHHRHAQRARPHHQDGTPCVTPSDASRSSLDLDGQQQLQVATAGRPPCRPPRGAAATAAAVRRAGR